MMSLEKISEQICQLASQQKYPPVELWDPPYCGEMAIEIKADGSWYYQGSAFKRMPLVKLFASVLKKEGDAYFLVTPVEKIKISVEHHPYVITEWRWLDDDQHCMALTTHLGDEFVLDEQHPVSLDKNGAIEVLVRRNLSASIHRNVYYQWVELADEINFNGRNALAFNSSQQQVVLGYLD